jgi:hypothetical protein
MVTGDQRSLSGKNKGGRGCRRFKNALRWMTVFLMAGKTAGVFYDSDYDYRGHSRRGGRGVFQGIR